MVLNQNEEKIITAMPEKESIYGLLSPKRLNPNLVAIGAFLLILVLILVLSGRYSRITLTKSVSIETNLPTKDSVKSDK